MHINLPSLSFNVARPLTISGGVGASIRVLDGRLWLTEEDCLDDVFLSAGQTYTLKNPGRVVIESDCEARVVVDAAVSIDARQPVPARWLDAWRVLAYRVRQIRRGTATPAFAN